MGADGNQPYSTLEAVPQQPVYHAYRQEKPLPTDSGKQVASDEGKQYMVDSGGIEVAANHVFYAHDFGGHHVQAHRPLRRKRIIFGGAIGSIAILAAVLGGVFGSRHESSATASLTSPSNSSTTSASTAPPQRNIAALSFSSNSVNNTRVYFQDDVGQILEAANSADNTTWRVSRTSINRNNGSSIAAAVSRSGFSLVISIFYLDMDNHIHDITWTPSTGKWDSGALSRQGYITMPNSSLAAMYNQCKLCANTTIIAFQDANGFVQIGNLTSSGWTLTQLGAALNPEMGTGLALQPFYPSGLEDQINLYHQRSDLNMIDGWSLNEQTYHTIPSGSPIAAASSYSNVSTGYETWINVLSISNRGIEVNTWSGAINDWLEQYAYPSVMASSTSNKKVYGNVAVTATGNAFGAVTQDGQVDTIRNWQFADDMVDWSLTGNVDLGGTWG